MSNVWDRGFFSEYDSVIACIDEGQTICYAHLDLQADRLAEQLAEEGVNSGSRVALCLPRGIQYLVASTAVLRTGGVYVPLELEHPAERIRKLVEASRPTLLIGRPDELSSNAAIAGGLKILSVPEDESRLRGAVRPACADLDDSSAPAYVIYTSGSTGGPKGVVGTRGGLRHLIRWSNLCWPVAVGDRAAWLASLAFDASLWEVWPVLAAGGTLVAGSSPGRQSRKSLCDWLCTHEIRRTFLPPVVVDDVRDAIVSCDKLRIVFTGGDVLRLSGSWPQSIELVNAYGPTEATVAACAHSVLPIDGALPPIGRPLPGVKIYLLGADDKPVEVGERGEIVIGGPGVAKGYLDDLELTNQKFVSDRFSTDGELTMYRSGDYAAQSANGELTFLGRIDRQLQFRGVRMEPREIEQVLESLSGVWEAAVVIEDGPMSSKQMIAFIVGAEDVTNETVMAAMKTQLPLAMVPMHIERVSHLPSAPSGERDDAQLLRIRSERAHLEARRQVDPEYIETTVTAAWCEVLSIRNCGRHDSFFQLGGDSLGLVRLCYELERRGLQLSVVAAIENATIAAQVHTLS